MWPKATDVSSFWVRICAHVCMHVCILESRAAWHFIVSTFIAASNSRTSLPAITLSLIDSHIVISLSLYSFLVVLVSFARSHILTSRLIRNEMPAVTANVAATCWHSDGIITIQMHFHKPSAHLWRSFRVAVCMCVCVCAVYFTILTLYGSFQFSLNSHTHTSARTTPAWDYQFWFVRWK